MNIFLAGGDWRPGPSLRPARAGPGLRGAPAPPALPRQQYRTLAAPRAPARQSESGNLFTALPFPSDRRGKQPAASFLRWGEAPRRGQSPCPALGGELHKSTTSAKKSGRPRSPPPWPGWQPVLPEGRCEGDGWRGGKEAEGERAGRGLQPGGGRQRAAAVSGNLGRGVLRSAGTHRGRHQARREGRRALSPALKSHRRPSLFSQHFIGGCFISISSFHPREKTHHPPPPPPKTSTSTSVYLWKKE